MNRDHCQPITPPKASRMNRDHCQPITPDQVLSANRVYQIQAAVQSLNEALAPRSFSADFRFIARSWRLDSLDGTNSWPASTPTFHFTYFLVTTFENPRIIFDKIRKSTDAWNSFLDRFKDDETDGFVRQARNFIREMLETNRPTVPPPDLLHHHLLSLFAAVDVDNLIPGPLQAFHESLSDEFDLDRSARGYLVTVRPIDPEGKEPDIKSLLDFEPILLSLNDTRTIPRIETYAKANGYGVKQRDVACFNGERANSNVNIAAVYWDLSNWLRGRDRQRKRLPSEFQMLWIPVYEASQSGQFAGRFLGWLFKFLDKRLKSDNAVLRKDVSDCISTCNCFSQELIEIDNRSFLTLAFNEQDKKNPEHFLARHLSSREGWKNVQAQRPWTHSDNDIREQCNEWWRVVNEEFQVRLDPTLFEDPEGWGNFTDLGYLSLQCGSNVVPKRLTKWNSKDCLRQAKHIRDLARRVSCAMRHIRNAQDAKARQQAASWAHEVKNYTGPTIGTLRALSKERLGKKPREDAIERVLNAVCILNAEATAIHIGFADGRTSFESPSAAIVEAVLQYLLSWRAADLKLAAQSRLRWCLNPKNANYHWQETTTTQASMRELIRLVKEGELKNPGDRFDNLLTSRQVISSLALLREVVQNIRNRYPPDADSAIEIVGCIKRTKDHPVVATIKQTQVETSKPEAHPDPPEGIRRTMDIFGPPGLHVGTIEFRYPQPTSQQHDTHTHYKVVRQCTIQWR